MNLKRGMWRFGGGATPVLTVALLLLAAGCRDEQQPTGSRDKSDQPSAQPAPKASTTDKVARAAVLPVNADPASPPAGDKGSGSDAAPPPAKVDESKVVQTARVPGWYQWRGPAQNGISYEKNLPEKWNPDTNENVIWTADVGGMSSPVVWNGKLYTWTRLGEVKTGAEDYPTLAPGPLTQEALTCVDINTGNVLWQHKNNMTQTEVPFHRLGWSSPCVDPSTGRVYALGSQCWMLCLDGDTGKVVWDRQMTEEFGMISTFGGRTQAPMVDEDQLFITGVAFGWGDHARSQHRIFAFNKHTGELNWSNGTGGIPVDAPQNTPVIAVVNGQRLVIFAAGDGGIHAFQPRTGKKAWAFKASKRGINTSVVVDGDRLYCSHGLDNLDDHKLGRIFCIDIANLENGSPKEVWAIKGIEAAFPTPVVTDKYLYVVDDRANLHQIDKNTGKPTWTRGQQMYGWDCGSVGKASPVYADGKLYVVDGDGTFSIIQPAEKRSDVKATKVKLTEKLGREYVVYGSPAIVDGRMYVQAATKLYCIGNKDQKPEYVQIPPLPEEKAPEQGKPALVQVVPADVALHAGRGVTFTARAFDANGRLLGEAPADRVKWSIAQLTIPAPPPRPRMPQPENAPPVAPAAGGAPAAAGAPGAGGAAPGAPADNDSEAARKQLAEAVATQPVAAAPPTKAGNLKGSLGPDGSFKSQAGAEHQGGAVEATVGNLTGQARVRVFPPLPWNFDFKQAPVGKPPLTWLGAGGKFAVVEDPDDCNNKVLQKLLDIDLYYRARTNFGTVDMSDYTVQADAKVNEKVISDRKYLPSAAVINSRYVLVMEGMGQVLQIHVWPSALPDSSNKTMPFPFDAKKWYRMKLQVTREGDKAVARGKAWPAGAPESKDWMLTLEDPIPNRQGNPGLFGVSLVGQIKSEVYYDNILVTPNGGSAVPAAATDAGGGAGDGK